MALTKEQIKELKEQLKAQVQNLPDDKKSEALKQIDEMSDEAIESMLAQQQASSQKIFRSIVSGEIPSVQIDSNSEAIAVLSVKAISKGHTIVIPKNEIAQESQISKEIQEFSDTISKKLLTSLKAKSTKILPEMSFGEIIINIIPVYDEDLSLNSPREDKTPEQLQTLKKEINVISLDKKPAKVIKPKRKRKPRPIKLKRRVP